MNAATTTQKSIHADPQTDPRWRIEFVRDRLGTPHKTMLPIIGSRFGARRVVAVHSPREIDVICDCGHQSSVEANWLRRGFADRCKKCSRVAIRKYDDLFANARIGALVQHRYSCMVSRCHSESSSNFYKYGKRGIRVYEPWLKDRKSFFLYIQTLPGWDKPGLEMDRIDNERGYAPGNIRFTTGKENSRNRKTNRILEIHGESICLFDFWKKYCPKWKSYGAVAYHMDKGRSPEWIADHHEKTFGDAKCEL